MSDRPAVPAQLERDLLLEAGHRCAIPTCRAHPVELAHIVPWQEVHAHAFENMIALCPTCHTRYDKGEIDRKAMLQYKANLAWLNGRYSDLERRVLARFARFPGFELIWLTEGLDILLENLIDDGLLEKTDRRVGSSDLGVPGTRAYAITDSGKALVQRWRAHEKL